MRAYPEQVIQQISDNSNLESTPTNNKPVVVYVNNQDTWEWAIKALVLVGCIILLAYVAKKLFE